MGPRLLPSHWSPIALAVAEGSGLPFPLLLAMPPHCHLGTWGGGQCPMHVAWCRAQVTGRGGYGGSHAPKVGPQLGTAQDRAFFLLHGLVAWSVGILSPITEV